MDYNQTAKNFIATTEEIDNAKIAESKNGRDLIEITIMKAASWGK